MNGINVDLPLIEIEVDKETVGETKEDDGCTVLFKGTMDIVELTLTGKGVVV